MCVAYTVTLTDASVIDVKQTTSSGDVMEDDSFNYTDDHSDRCLAHHNLDPNLGAGLALKSRH
ncbi:MAG: hypothetical protein ACREOM_09060 [Candidatus Dormibacteraceae bacterium]